MIRIPKLDQSRKIKYVFFLLCLLCISQYFGISPLNLLLTVAIIAVCCLADLDDLFVIMYMTLPFFNLISYRIGTYSMHYLIIGIFIVKYLLSSKVSVFKLITFLLLFIMRIFANDFVLLVSWSLLILPLILTIDDDIWMRNGRKILFWLNLSMLLSCITGYIMMIMEKSIYTNSYLYISGVRTVRFAGLTGDSNVFGETCALIICMNLIYCFFNKDKSKKFYVITSLLLVVASLLSYSKTTLICITVVFVIFLILYAKTNATDRLRLVKVMVGGFILVMLISVCVLTLAHYSGNSTVVLGYIDRFTREDLTTGRLDIWKVYLGELTSSPQKLFLPLTSEELSTPIWNPSTASYVAYVHNLYLETIAVFGWSAAFLIFIWVGSRIYRYFALHNKLILAIPVLLILIMGIGSHGNLEYQFYLQFALALSFLNPMMESALQNKNAVLQTEEYYSVKSNGLEDDYQIIRERRI